MIATITRHISKGVTNISDTSKKMTWFKTNFNMPVEDFSGGTYTRYNGPVTYDTETTSYSLSGFVPGYEICNGIAVYDWANDGGSDYNIDTLLYVFWGAPDSSSISQIANGYHFTYTVAPGFYISYFFTGNIGCAGWEISTNDTYKFISSATGTPAIGPLATDVTITNCPSTTQLDSSKRGFIWVESNDLCFLNSNQWKHTIVGTFVSTTPGTSKAGFMWIDTSNDLHWVGANGSDYKVPWKVQQFASFYTTGPTNEVNAGTSKAGFIWVDNEFGLTHLSYIGYNGYKWLVGAGENPY